MFRRLISTATLVVLLAAGLFAAGTAFASTSGYVSPGKPVGFVNDFANILSAPDKAALESKLSMFEKETGVEITVATVQSLGDDDVDDYAVKLFQEWGVGDQRADNGLLILVAPNDREARIEVGYGLEGTITDAQASVVLNDIFFPAFKQGDYAGGLNDGIDKIIGFINNDPDAVSYFTQSIQNDQQTQTGATANAYIIALSAIVAVNLLAYMSRTKSWWLGGVVGLALGIFLVGTLLGAVVCTGLGLLIDYLLSTHGSTWFRGPRGPGGWWFLGGGGNGRGGGNGGFGGFGGGHSGGGGASGRW